MSTKSQQNKAKEKVTKSKSRTKNALELKSGAGARSVNIVGSKSKPSQTNEPKGKADSKTDGKTDASKVKPKGLLVLDQEQSNATRMKSVNLMKPKIIDKMDGQTSLEVPKKVLRIAHPRNVSNDKSHGEHDKVGKDLIITEDVIRKVSRGSNDSKASALKIRSASRKQSNATHNTKLNNNTLKQTKTYSSIKEESLLRGGTLVIETKSSKVANTAKGGVRAETDEKANPKESRRSNNNYEGISTTTAIKYNPAKKDATKRKKIKKKPVQDHVEIVPLDWSRVKGMDLLPPDKEPFVRYDNVVVATKVIGPSNTGQLKQMICLFTAAYNRHVNYDIVVFTTLPWGPENMREVQAIAPQTNISFVLEGPPLEDQVAAMTPEERDYLYQRCKIHPYGKKKVLSWFDKCAEGSNKAFNVKLGYAWQSEFRAYHIWKMPVLAPYKYMLWMDTDALCSQPWTTDPMKVMIENDLVLMFDNRAGSTRNPLLLEKLKRVYNRTICDIGIDSNGRFRPKAICPESRQKFAIPQIHGFHHITNLDFYRSKTNLKFLEVLVETHRFSREWDDQLGVTIPPAMEAPERAWDYEHNGIDFRIYHNGRIDGREPVHVGYHIYWKKTVKRKWDSAREMCDALVIFSGRR